MVEINCLQSMQEWPKIGSSVCPGPDALVQIQRRRYRASHTKVEPSPEEEVSPDSSEKKNDAAAAPRREGLRPRQSIRAPRLQLSSQDFEDDEQNSSDREVGHKGTY